MAAAESSEEGADIAASPQGEPGKLQAGDPALRAALQERQLLLSQFEVHDLLQKAPSLFGREAQIESAYFGELTTSAQPCQVERRIGSRGDDEVHLRREMLQQKEER